MPNDRLAVLKTYKLFIDGKFPRSESGRTVPVAGTDGGLLAHVSRASRKDLRDAVTAARKAQDGWANATAYLRGQILYRTAEMLEGRKSEFIDLLRQGRRAADKPSARAEAAKPVRRRKGAPSARAEGDGGSGPAREVDAAIDRLVCFGGWADKYAQVLGCNNPVAGPYYNFTVPEPTGVVGVIAPDEAPLLALVSLIAAPLCAGNTVVALGSQASPPATAVFGEVLATSDVPPGVVNLLTGLREELIPVFASHRDIDGIHAAVMSDVDRKTLQEGVAENLKRVRVHGDVDWFDEDACHSPWWIEPFVEMKTVWHPSGT